MTRELAHAVENAVEAGENVTKHHIETRGTEGTGKRGRVETGRMRDSVGSRMDEQSASGLQGRFGWLDEQPEYARFQEPGFTHTSGITVEGMFALSDAAEEVVQDLRDDIDKIVRNS